MNLYNLKIFVDTARLGSMTKAAEINALSRPAVSQAIKKLEDELGVQLLVHQRRALQTTALGRTLVANSENLFSEVEKLEVILKKKNSPVIGEFKVGSSRILATHNLPQVLRQMRNEFPLTSIQVQMANSSVLVQKLERREIDVAFFIGDESIDGAKQVVVGRGSFVLIKPKFANEEELSYAITERRPETERLKTLFARATSRTLPVFAEVHSWDAIWHCVQEGICGGLVPDILLRTKEGKGGNIMVAMPKIFPYEVKAMFLASRSGDPVIKSFVSYFQSGIKDLKSGLASK